MTDMRGEPEHRSGYVSIVGRPNVGKSTLLNRLLARKLAIVTPKPQTTRRRLLGIRTLPEAQLVFVDTPGIHRARDLMNARMVEEAKHALEDADVILWIIDAADGMKQADGDVAQLLQGRGRPVIVVLNKLDRCSKPRLLPLMRELGERLPGAELIPFSALTGENEDLLLRAVIECLPQGPRYFPAEDITTETERAIVAEIVREKIMLETRDEVPYAVAVTIDSFEERPDKAVAVIRATVHVDKQSQKPILIGQGGGRLKAIGQAARKDIEDLLGRRVYLEIFVRVQPDWTKQASRLKEFGL